MLGCKPIRIIPFYEVPYLGEVLGLEFLLCGISKHVSSVGGSSLFHPEGKKEIEVYEQLNNV